MNLFPYTIVTPDGRQAPNARIVSDGVHTALWVSTTVAEAAGLPPVDVVAEGRVALVFHVERLVIPRPGGGYTLLTDLGDVTLVADSGCGCGHPLKRFTPPMPDAPGVANRTYAEPTETAP